MTGRVETVAGPRARVPDGLVDAHGHTWIAPPPGVTAPDAPRLCDEPAIRRELGAFRAAGGAAVVDCQPPGCGRDAARLVALSRATGVDIVAATGFHLGHYYPPAAWIWSAPEPDVADFFVRELTAGMADAGTGESPPRAGVIKTAFTGTLAAPEGRLLAAAALASRETGAAILVHTERGAGAELLAEFFARHGVAAGRVVLCHVDKRPDPGLHRALADAGFLLEYDTFLRPRYAPQTGVWPLLERMLSDGYAHAVACGLDLADAAMWRFGSGGPGMLGLSEVVVPGLRALGAGEAAIRALTGGNIYARMAIS